MNQDYSQRVAYQLDAVEWEASPAAGVWRKKLEREGEESGRATSLVRYEPGSAFRPHTHDGGEEILVLEGTFSDDSGDFPQGCYFRNPPGTSHAPSSVTGCVLFVKLCHFDAGDTAQLATMIADKHWRPQSARRTQLVHQFNQESTSIISLTDGETLSPDPLPLGQEVLVIKGNLKVGDDAYPAYSWLRLPAQDNAVLTAVGEDTLLLVKRGHFPPSEGK